MYGDKLIDTKDMASFAKLKLEIAKANFEVLRASLIMSIQ